MLSNRLRSARKSRNWTQDMLAKKVNTTKATISNYENGHSTPSNEMMILLADTLEVTTDYLLGRTDEKDSSIIRGKEEDVSDLSDYQRTILEWAKSQPSLSMVENKEELSKILDDIAFIFEYERRKKDNN